MELFDATVKGIIYFDVLSRETMVYTVEIGFVAVLNGSTIYCGLSLQRRPLGDPQTHIFTSSGKTSTEKDF